MKRNCMTCQRPFDSEGIHNRMCRACVLDPPVANDATHMIDTGVEIPNYVWDLSEENLHGDV